MAQIKARYDIYAIEPWEGGYWMVRGYLYDPTGSYSPIDVSIGDYVICMDYSESGEMVYDRFTVNSIYGYEGNSLDLILEYAEEEVIKGRCQQPKSGSFPFVSRVKGYFTGPIDCDLYQIETHYQYAIEYYNLLNDTTLSHLVDWGTFTENTTISQVIERGYKLSSINFRNTGPVITLIITRVDDGQEVAYAEMAENGDLSQTINIPGIGGSGGFALSSESWNGNSIHIVVSIESMFI